mgnify:FL=1
MFKLGSLTLTGKTTMLDILAGRKKAGRVSGEVYVNGAPITNSPYWKRISGYVTQDDVLDPAFTVRETLRYIPSLISSPPTCEPECISIYTIILRYAAMLRLPSSMSTKMKYERVEQVIADLSLQHVAESPIGGQWVRGISGGEKRRVSIGIELITNPSAYLPLSPQSLKYSISLSLSLSLCVCVYRYYILG